jgi:hypothetical protein
MGMKSDRHNQPVTFESSRQSRSAIGDILGTLLRTFTISLHNEQQQQQTLDPEIEPIYHNEPHQTMLEVY